MMNVTDEMVEALMTALGHEGVYVGNKTGHRALTAALSAAPVPAIDAERVAAAYERGWNDCLSEPRPFRAARESMRDRYITELRAASHTPPEGEGK